MVLRAAELFTLIMADCRQYFLKNALCPPPASKKTKAMFAEL